YKKRSNGELSQQIIKEEYLNIQLKVKATKQAQKSKHLDIEFGTQTGAEGQHPQYET
ncbi:37290_t:CDS:2, partial [Gigaspora margarita]